MDSSRLNSIPINQATNTIVDLNIIYPWSRKTLSGKSRKHKNDKCVSIKRGHLKLSLRIVLIILCIIGFIYQTQELLSLYFSGKTVAENRYVRRTDSNFPAITLCFPLLFTMDNFAKMYLDTSDNIEYRNISHNYQQFISKVDQKW